MNKLINYILWPAVAGLIFALVLLQMPRVVSFFPGLAVYFPTTATPQPQLIQSSVNSYSKAYKIAAPAVVSINSQQSILNTAEGQFDLLNASSESNSIGSGVIISPDGYIITSYHILYTLGTFRLSENSTITLSDGRNIAARTVVIDEANDLALLKINAENLPFIGLAPQNDLEVGDVVLAIGNPRNVGQSVSMGIISALLSRNDSYIIQTDAAINPGNSGGALIDIDGNLIGINSTIVSESGGYEGIGFATPAYQAIDLLNTYISEGPSGNGPSGYLGVDGTALTVIDGLRRLDQVVQGIFVNAVTKDSPAAIAGIKPGDLITEVNGRKLIILDERDTSAITSITDYGPEQNITLSILRDRNTLQIPVILGIGEPTAYIYLPNEQ